jgi:hypothetical protein
VHIGTKELEIVLGDWLSINIDKLSYSDLEEFDANILDIENDQEVILQPDTFSGINPNGVYLIYMGRYYTGIGDDIPPILNPSTGLYYPASYYNDGNIISDVPCYSKGTKILCETGYIPVEELVPGTIVKTLNHGYLEVEIINHGKFENDPTNWNRCMYRLPKQGDMIDDLVITGGHGILVDTLPDDVVEPSEGYYSYESESKIDDHYLLIAAFNNRFEKIESNSVFDYYHFNLKGETDRRYAVWANGVLSESTFKKCIN